MKNHFLASGLIIGLTFLVYANSFKNEFVYDDHILIAENEFIKDWGNLPGIFTRDYFRLANEASYRPVCTLTFFLDYSLWKLDVPGWHFTNTLFHVANAILIYWITFLLLKPGYRNKRPDYTDNQSDYTLYLTPDTSFIPLLSALLFALHPVQTEAVAGISFREDLISFFFFLLAFYFYIKSIQPSNKQTILYFASCISFIFALFSKETAVTLPLVILLYHFCFPGREKKKSLPYFLIAGIYLLVRFVFLRAEGYLPGINVSGEPVYPGGTFFTRMSTMSGVFFYYLKLIFFPFRLTIHYNFPLAKSFLEPHTLAGLGSLVIIFVSGCRVRKTYPAISFSLFYFVLVLLPVSNIIPFGAVLQERYLYYSVFSFSLFLALIIAQAFPPSISGGLRFGVYFCILSILALYSLRTIERNYDWKNDILLWSKVLEIYPESAKADFALGDAYFKKGELDKAIEHYQKVLGKSGKEKENGGQHRSIVYNDLGLIYLEKKDYDSAIAEFKKGLEINPGSPLIRNNLGIAYIGKNEYNSAASEFRKAIEINPKSEEAYFNLVRIYLDQGEYREAGEILRQLEKVNPQSPRLKRMHRQHQEEK